MARAHRKPAVQSPWRIFGARLVRNRIAMIGGITLFLLYSMALMGSFIGPYDPGKGDYNYPDHPPSKIHFVDADGKFHLRPFLYRTNLTNIRRRIYETDTTRRYPIQFFVKDDTYRFWWLIDSSTHLFGVTEAEGAAAVADEPPVKFYLFGSDRLGRCVFSRILSGAKISLSIGLLGIAITMTLGLFIGGISGYLGGIPDAVIMRFVELLMTIPGLYLILAIRAALSGSNPMLKKLFGLDEWQSLSSVQIYLLMVGILGFVSWAGTARVIRGMVLAIKRIDYVSAARVIGASPLRIIVHHLLPNTLTYVIVAATLSVPSYILGEVALSFLGVGIEEPQASWGNMLNDAQNLRTLVDFPWMLIPGVFIFITVFAFNFFGDGIRDALDPKYLK